MQLGKCYRTATAVTVGAIALSAALVIGSGARSEEPLVKYNGNTSDYWSHPPTDWYLGDYNAAQNGERPYPGQPTPTPSLRP